MEENLENSTTATAAAQEFPDDTSSCCSTPYVSAPSSPGRGAPVVGCYYSAPASPMHFMLSTTNLSCYPTAVAAPTDSTTSFEFDFSATLTSTAETSAESMTSADELFFNGQIRPVKFSAHIKRPQLLGPLIESDDVVEEGQTLPRGRELKFRTGSVPRRTRSMSPMRSQTRPSEPPDTVAYNPDEEKGSGETTPCASRSSSAGRSSKRWVFLKEFLYRSKSEGRNEGRKFWGALSFSPVRDKKMAPLTKAKEQGIAGKDKKKDAVNKSDGGKRRGIPASAHELHYAAKKAQAEEMRKKTFLPYRQGLLGCLGFSSKSYGAMNGFARAFGTVSSR